MANDKVARLKAYVEDCKNKANSALDINKRDFFEREIRKANAQLAKLTQ